MSEFVKIIEVEPDKPCLLAQRLVRRLVRDRLIPVPSTIHEIDFRLLIAEALADEIHMDIVGGTLRKNV